MSHPCTACNVTIDTNFKDHFKTDWHLYNLKRKVASLPPVSETDFKEKLKLVSSQAATNDNQVPEKFYCEMCHKKFTESGPYLQHLQSKQHVKLQTQVSSGNKLMPASRTTSQAEEIESSSERPSESDKEETISIKECLFCGCSCDTLDNTLRHMENKHSFTIPDKDALKDLEGLLQCLGDIIASEHRCLWCLQPFSSMRSTRQHMLDKNHTRIQTDGDAWLIYTDFYDYEATGEYEMVSDDESDEEEEDDDNSGEIAYERVLPSGAVIGCRTLRLYYRQYLPNTTPRNAALRALPSSTANLLQLACRSQTGEWQIATSAARTQHKWTRADLSYLQRCKQKKQMKLGIQANKLQKHFRVQLN